MVLCAAFGCGNRSSRFKESQEKGLSYFSFPTNPARRRAWIRAIGFKNWEPSKNSFLCSKHFEEHYIDRTSLFSVRLEKNAIPTIFSGLVSNLQEKPTFRSPPKCREFNPVDILSLEVQNSTLSVKDSTLVAKSSIVTAKDEDLSPDVEISKTEVIHYYKKEISDLRKSYTEKIKGLQQRTRRQTKKNALLKDIIAILYKSLSEKNIMPLQNIETSDSLVLLLVQ